MASPVPETSRGVTAQASRWRTVGKALGMAVSTVGAATALTALLWPWGQQTPFALFYVAVLVAAVYGGVWAGALSAVLSIVAAEYMFFSPRWPFALDQQGAVASGLFAVVAGFMVLLVRRARMTERRRRGTEARLGALLDAVREAIVTVDADQNVEQFNAAAERMFGCTATQAKGQALTRFLPQGIAWDEGLASLPVDTADTTGAGPPLRTVTARRASGDPFAAEATVSRLRAGPASAQLFMLVLRDITVRQRYQAEIERLNRLYAALSHINQAIVLAPSRDVLFPQVCEFLVQYAGLRMAWIGWHDQATQEVVPIAQCGDDTGYLRQIRVFADERPEGNGPSGKALRQRRPYISNHMEQDPATSLWRDAARVPGFRSSASFPIEFRGRVCALLNVYAQEPGFFQDQEVALLTEATTDIAFALEKFAREDEAERLREVARLERAFSATMVESMPGIVYFYNEDGRFLRWNRDFELATGYDGGEIGAMHPLDFFAGDDRQHVANTIADVFDRGASSLEAMLLSKDGRRTPYLLTGRRIVFDGKPCLLGMGIDITERHVAEAALRELNDLLERKVDARTGELQAALARAESADQLKSAFLAAMSHELRTPLNSILGFTSILIQGLAGALNGEQTKQLGMVRTSARHLLDLINDVLDISKIEAGQLQVGLAPFDLAQSIQRAVASVRPMADAKGLRLVTNLPAGIGFLHSDRRRVEQILLNLLNNAIKFTESGTVTLSVEILPHSVRPGHPGDGLVRIQVRDTGIGIRASDLRTLFQPFRQIDTGLARQYEGTGLGLAICRRLAGLLGGHIEVHSVWGQGSTFTLTLPLTQMQTD